MQKNSSKKSKQDSGNAMLITTILLLVMTVLVAACINISGMQFDLSLLQRNTSNTYYLAQSGVEKEVDMINKALQTEMVGNLENIKKQILDPVTTFSIADCSSTTTKESYIVYQDAKLKIKQSVMEGKLREYTHNFISNNFLGKDFIYTVKSDRAAATALTEVTVKAEAVKNPSDPSKDKDCIKVTATAVTKNGSEVLDTQKVEAIVNVNLKNIENEIKEKYVWIGNPPEILDSAVTCFSDMIVTNKAKLTVHGDIRVKGSKKVSNLSTIWPDADESGGLIVSNGAELNVKKRTDLPGHTADSADTTGNIYCMNNVATTNGFGAGGYGNATKIEAAGDIVADTVAIFDDFYSGGANSSPFGATGNKVRNNTITVQKNIFTDDDVKIDQWTEGGGINVGGSIFGISNNNPGGVSSSGTIVGLVDPNSSSGVYNQGLGTRISAKQMFVFGQPFITLTEGGTPIRLWESIGEPFDGVRTLKEYSNPDPGNYQIGTWSYLSDREYEDYIKRNKISIGEFEKSYATAFISANSKTEKSDDNFLNEANAGKLFNLGGYIPSGGLKTIMQMDSDEQVNKKLNIMKNTEAYYKGDPNLFDKSGMYKKFYTAQSDDILYWKGLKAYMTAMRSVFYGTFSGAVPSPSQMRFDNMVSVSELTADLKKVKWSYSNPIEIIAGGNISIDKYYVKDDKPGKIGGYRPYPTIIFNNTADKLVITTADTTKNLFRGIIISKGDVEIQGNIIIEGCVIIGGANEGALTKDRADIVLGNTVKASGTIAYDYSPGLKIAATASGASDVTIIQNPDVLLEMNFAHRNFLREVLDALKIAQYKGNTNLGKILGPYNYEVESGKGKAIDSNKPAYTMGRVMLSKKSVLDIKTDQIKLTIKNMKKVN